MQSRDKDISRNNIRLKSVSDFLGSAKIIWAGVAFIVSSLFISGDLRWVTKEDFGKYKELEKQHVAKQVNIILINQLRREIADLEESLLYTDDPKHKAMLEARIIQRKRESKTRTSYEPRY